MCERCTNPSRKGYYRYGAVGIGVFEGWADFTVFRDWALASGYADNLSIERRENGLGYGPENCTWIPMSDQWRNKKNVALDDAGRPWCEIAEENGISKGTYGTRLRRGASPRDAATAPLDPRGSYKRLAIPD